MGDGPHAAYWTDDMQCIEAIEAVSEESQGSSYAYRRSSMTQNGRMEHTALLSGGERGLIDRLPTLVDVCSFNVLLF